MGFRGFVYTDWQGYYIYYEQCPSFFAGFFKVNQFIIELADNFPYMERGFLLYLLFCKTISANYFFLQIFSFLIDFFILFFFFKRFIPHQIIFGFLLYILFSGFMVEFNLLRNSKAIMIFLISLKYINQRKIVKYILLNILGSLFHVSAVLYLPLYFINRKFSRKIILFLFILGNLIFILQLQWCKFILLSIASLFSSRLSILLEMYLSWDKTSQPYGITIGYLERFFSFIIIYYYSNSLYKKDKSNLIFINFYFLYSFIFLFFSEITILLDRVAILFIFPYWILYPRIYDLLSRKYKQVFLLILLFYGCLKMAGNNNIMTIYDNILFGNKSYNERKYLMRFYKNNE
jgi:hypothetical protein